MQPDHKVCSRCLIEKPITDFSPHGNRLRAECRPCRAEMSRESRAADLTAARERDRKSYWKNVERKRAALRQRSSTPEFKAYMKRYRREYYKNHPEIIDKVKAYNAAVVAEVTTYYGGKCALCGGSWGPCLVIDHVNNANSKPFRTDPGCAGGNTFYRKLKSLGYPAGFQVLCANCNWRKEMTRRAGRDSVQIRYRLRLKEKVLNHYGISCRGCGVDDSVVLVLDHINNDGAEHRKELLGSSSQGGIVFYRKLIQLGYPDGLQTLCWNCNTAKSRGYNPLDRQIHRS